MKILVILILIAIGVFLFRRTQRLAKEEQEASQPKSAPITPVVPREEVPSSPAAEPEQMEPVDLAVVTPVVETVIEVEAELMPRDPEYVQSAINISVDIDTDIIEVDIPATHNEQAVIILGSTDVDEQTEAAGVDVLKAEIQTAAPVATGAQAPGDWANVTLMRAFKEYQAATSVNERYSALQNMVGECYKQRKSADYRNYGAQLVQEYIALFQAVTAEQGKTAELKSTGFLHLATLLNDTQAFDAAIALCRKALEFGLSDGTVTGFEGRIARIEKAQTKAATT